MMLWQLFLLLVVAHIALLPCSSSASSHSSSQLWPGVLTTKSFTSSSSSSSPPGESFTSARKLLLLGMNLNPASNDAQEFFRFQTRRTWDAKEVSPQFCCWNNQTSSCNWVDYAQAISLLLVAPVVIGVFFIFFFGILFCCRCCCLRHGSCMLPWRGSLVEPIILSIPLAITALLLIGLVCLGVLGNYIAHQGVTDTANEAESYADTLIKVTNNAANLLIMLDPSQSNTSQVAKSDASTAQSAINSAHNILVKYVETARLTVVSVIFFGVLSISIGTIFSLFCFQKKSFCSQFCYSLFVMIPVILLIVFCIGTGAIVSDACQGYSEGLMPQIFNSYGVDCSSFQNLFDTFQNEAKQSAKALCSEYNRLCGIGVLIRCANCSATFNVTRILQTDVNETISCNSPYCPSNTCSGGVCYSRILTVQECSTSCIDLNYKNTSAHFVDDANTFNLVSQTLPSLEPYVGCGVVTQFQNATENGLCVDYLAGDFFILLASVGIGFLWLLYEPLNLLAFERACLKIKKNFEEDGL